MSIQVMSTVVGAAIIIVLATVGAHATPGCPSTISCIHRAPAPLLAAGIPAFLALGGGVAARQMWRRFVRRS